MLAVKPCLHPLLALFCIAGASDTVGQSYIFDQTNENPPYAWESIPILGPFGQEFRPTLPSLNFVDLALRDFNLGSHPVGLLTVSIHSDTISGPILGVSSLLPLPPAFDGVAHFDFATAVPLTAAERYVLDVQVVSGGNWAVGLNEVSTYEAGRMIKTFPVENSDLFFREGITVVPEPSTFICLAFGLAAFWAVQRKAT